MEQFKHVFVEPEEYRKDLYGTYRIFHNCDCGSARWGLYLLEYGDNGIEFDEDCLIIDEDSLSFLYDIFDRHVPDFDCYAYWNPIKPETYRRIRAEILRLAEELEQKKCTRLTFDCWRKTNVYLGCTTRQAGEFWEDFHARTQPLIDFCRAFLWYFDEHKFFQYDNQGRILNLCGW